MKQHYRKDDTMAGLDILNMTISMQDLQKKAPSIINEVSSTQKEKIIIHDNKLKAVLISAEMYDDYLKRLSGAPAAPASKNITIGTKPSKRSNNRSTDASVAPFTYDYNSSLNDIARDAFDYLEKNQLLSNDQLYNLCNGLYCKDMFGMSYPILKRIHNKILLSTEIVIDSQVRYWKQIYTFNNKFYVLYSLLYDKQKSKFVDWMDGSFGED